MSAERTVTVHTFDHGPIVISEPSWCAGLHEDGLHLVDLEHTSAKTVLTVDTERGPVELLHAMLTQAPYAERPESRRVNVAANIGGDYQRFRDETALRLLAAQLVVEAYRLRVLAYELASLHSAEAGR